MPAKSGRWAMAEKTSRQTETIAVAVTIQMKILRAWLTARKSQGVSQSPAGKLTDCLTWRGVYLVTGNANADRKIRPRPPGFPLPLFFAVQWKWHCGKGCALILALTLMFMTCKYLWLT